MLVVRNSIVGMFLACAVALAVSGCQGQSAKASSESSPIKTYYARQKWSIAQPNGKADVFYKEYWYRQPDSFRQQIIRKKLEYVQIINPTEGIVWYDPSGTTKGAKPSAMVVPTATAGEMSMLSKAKVGPVSDEELIKRTGPGAKIVGKETVLGRVCDVVTAEGPDNRKTTAVVDRTTGMALRTSESKGGKKVFEITVVDFKVNEPIPDEVFSYKLPNGTFLVKGPAGLPAQYYSQQNNLSRPAVDERLRELVKLKRVKADVLYRPTYIPTGYSVNGAPELYQDPIVIAISYLNHTTGDVVAFRQLASDGAQRGSKFEMDGFSGTKISGNEPYPYIMLSWKSEGSSFTLFTSNMSEAETIKIAKSVKPVK